MDKFLLLRNNKQTGPYSAAELEKMGLKPYDLIWVEGKSAAWRYPGEIDALKPFSPPVEEQPYDRFYKKEAEETIPQLPREETKPSPSIPKDTSRHIFVSVPSVNKRTPSPKESPVESHAAYQPVPSDERNSSTERELIMSPVNIPAPLPKPQKEFTQKSYEKPTSSATKNQKGIRPVHWMSAALVLFALISVFLYINYRQQHKQLNRLNEIVLNMQQGQQVQNAPIHNAVAPVIQTESAKIDTLGFTPQDYNQQPEKQVSATKKPVKPVIKNKDSTLPPPIDVIEEPKSFVETSQPVRTSRKRNIAEQVKVFTNEDFKVGFLGGISNLQVTVSNNSDKPLNKVQVQVEYLSKENKVVKTQVLTFRNLEAGSRSTQDVPRTARGVTVRAKVESVENADAVASNEDTTGKTP